MSLALVGLLLDGDDLVVYGARLQLLSRAIGDHIYRPAGVHALLRNAIMGAKSNDEWSNIMAWVYDGPKMAGSLKPQ